MAERLPQHETHSPSFEATEIKHPKHEASPKSHEAKTKSPAEVTELRSNAERESRSSSEVIAQIQEHEDKKKEATPTYTNKGLKDKAFNDIMRSTRRQLNPAERALSTVIHNPTINAISEGAAKTVGRPSGIIGGSLASLLVSAFFVTIAKRNGFPVPLSIFLVLFVGGYIAGVLVEMFLKNGSKALGKT